MRHKVADRKPVALITGLLILIGAVGAAIHRTDGQPPEAAAHRAANSRQDRLLAEIERYRENAAGQQPEKRVQQWFSLFERARAQAANYRPGDMSAFDARTGTMVSGRSMLAALPPPEAWALFRAEALRRTQVDGAAAETLAVRYLAEVLAGDRQAANATLDLLAKDEANAGAVAEARTLLASLYGDADSQITAFEAELAQSGDEYDMLVIPDLVALAGEQRAEVLLTRAVRSKRILHLDSSEPTSRLARRVATANVSKMSVAQWSLAQSVDAAPLYEALSERFGKASTGGESSPGQLHRHEAARYYFLAMVIQNRQADAERALEFLRRSDESIGIPRKAVEALQRAGMNERLFRFLDALLRRRPDIPAWNLYIEQAAYTGHAERALACIESTLKRLDLSDKQRSRLQSHQFDAYLASNRVEQAEIAANELLALPAKPGEPGSYRSQAAIKAMSVGRLLGRPALWKAGAEYALAAIALPPQDDSWAMIGTRAALYGELRLAGRPQEALTLANAHVNRKVESFQEAVMRRMGMDSGGDQQSLTEMASIYLQMGQPDEALDLMSSAHYWGAADLAQLMQTEDSQGVPLPVTAARALAAKGNTGAALRIAHATVSQLPGEDAAYELIARLDPNAIQAFDAMFSLDEFEERPLIWKATIQLAQGAVDEAETTIRQAIAIDPSDGEEGPDDRMRAYAVLSSILALQGDAEDARLYAHAVEAIRLSEKADRLHAAGLYQRAFAMYGEALEKFSDAYCIQSRLAVQLNKQGRRQEALAHYRRAYELMPSSFGRVESHCFGCESVFEGPDAQTLAERVFTEILRKTPEKPQAHYLLAYLREHQGRYEEAIQPLRAAVSLDARYLNAWKKLNGVARNTYIESGERDIARLKLLELDPLARHVQHDLASVGDLRGLWSAAQRGWEIRRKVEPPETGIYPLTASAKVVAEARSGRPGEVGAMLDFNYNQRQSLRPNDVFFDHSLVKNAARMMGEDELWRD